MATLSEGRAGCQGTRPPATGAALYARNTLEAEEFTCYDPRAVPARTPEEEFHTLTPEGSLFDARPEAFGSYRVRDEIGPGRFGPVYRATGGSPAVDVAVKVFDQGLTPEQARVLAESLTSLCQAPLAHPSIVSPVAAGAQGEHAWLAEPWFDGTPLDHIIEERGARPPADVLLHVTQLAAALDFAAAAGILHGALHPSDILFAGDRAMVTGLGVMQALSQSGLDVPMSGPGVSPQRALGLAVTHTDDIYSLAAITVEMLYGRPIENRRKIAAVVKPLPGIDDARLRDVLEGSLAEDPGDRPSTALEFAGALQSAIVETPPPAEVPVPAVVPDVMRAPDPPLSAPVELPEPVALRVMEFDDPRELREPAELREPGQPGELRELREPTNPELGTRNVEAAAVRVSWFGVAVGLAIGVLAGFAGGFVVGQRDATPTPTSASRAIPRAQREAVPAPTTGQGQVFTESTVPQAQVVEPEVKPSDSARAEEPRLQTESRIPPATRTTESGPRNSEGRVEVVSRPAGAQVFLDGRLVGRTPLTLSQVSAGSHAVRLALPGHQRWVTTVDVAPGAHARVAASLER